MLNNWIVYSSILLFLLSILCYRDTIIQLSFVWTVALISGITISFFLLVLLRNNKQPYWLTIASGLLIGGSISTFIILVPNYFLKSNTDLTVVDVDIIKSGNMSQRKSKCRTPFALVLVDNVEKELTFSCIHESTIKGYKKVRLNMQRGFWGFQIINDKQLI